MNDEREQAIACICDRTGKSRKQAEAFFDLVGSAFRRRGWVDGEPLNEDELRKRLDVFLGDATS